jgi:hypothetical protein
VDGAELFPYQSPFFVHIYSLGPPPPPGSQPWVIPYLHSRGLLQHFLPGIPKISHSINFVIKHAYSIPTTKMSFTRAIRQAFSSHKSQPQQPVGIYTQSPSEQYCRRSQSRPSPLQSVSLPPYQREAGVYTQSSSEVYVRRDSHRHAEPTELPRYQRVATSTSRHQEFYAPVSDYVPEYSPQESNSDERGQDGEPPQYQK